MPTVLIVDDDPAVRALLRMALSPIADIVEAADGAQGKAMALDTPPDAAVLDVMMPGVDGMEVLEAWRADPRMVDVPVILLTAMDREPDRIRGYRVGADAYLTKPFDVDGLSTLIGDLIEGRETKTTQLLDILRNLANMD